MLQKISNPENYKFYRKYEILKIPNLIKIRNPENSKYFRKFQEINEKFTSCHESHDYGYHNYVLKRGYFINFILYFCTEKTKYSFK